MTTSADMIAIILIIICALLGAMLGFTRGIFGFAGIYMGATYAAKNAADGNKYLTLLFGIFAGALVVGFLFYGSTRFTPMEAMDPVFGAILGFLIGWGACHGIFHYYVQYHPEAPFYAKIYDGKFAMDIHDIRPYQEMMNRTEGLRHPDPERF